MSRSGVCMSKCHTCRVYVSPHWPPALLSMPRIEQNEERKQGLYRGRERERWERNLSASMSRLGSTMLSTTGVSDSYPTHFFYRDYCVTVLYRTLFAEIGASVVNLAGLLATRQFEPGNFNLRNERILCPFSPPIGNLRPKELSKR